MSTENERYVEYILDWMREVYAAWKDEKKIKRPFKENSTNCNYCPIKDACWSEPDGDTKIKPLEVRS